MKKYKLLKFIACLLLATIFIPLIVKAQSTCEGSITPTTPTADFTIHGDGTATHNKTGLMWKMCVEGSMYNNGRCSYTRMGDFYPSYFTWGGALQRATAVNAGQAGERLGYSDWRVPNIKELQSIVEDQCSSSFNAEIFPELGDRGNSELGVWSSTPYLYFDYSGQERQYAYYVYIYDGRVRNYEKGSGNTINGPYGSVSMLCILVRGGQ